MLDRLHWYQRQILRELLFKPGSRFADLNISGLTSDHFSYHVKELRSLKLVSKDQNGKYTLTAKGKELANTMDTDHNKTEKQPKVGVLVVIERDFDGETKSVIQTRLKEPFYGCVGFPGGKVRFGETIPEAAVRETKEETCLDGGEPELSFILHEHVYNRDRELLEDKIFYVVTVTGTTGELQNFEGGENCWMTREEYRSIPLEQRYYGG